MSGPAGNYFFREENLYQPMNNLFASNQATRMNDYQNVREVSSMYNQGLNPVNSSMYDQHQNQGLGPLGAANSIYDHHLQGLNSANSMHHQGFNSVNSMIVNSINTGINGGINTLSSGSSGGGGGCVINEGVGSFSNLGFSNARSYQEMNMPMNFPKNMPSNTVNHEFPRGPFQKSLHYSDIALFESLNKIKSSSESWNSHGNRKRKVEYIDLTEDEDIPKLVESTSIDSPMENNQLAMGYTNPNPRNVGYTQPPSGYNAPSMINAQPPSMRVQSEYNASSTGTQHPFTRIRGEYRVSRPSEHGPIGLKSIKMEYHTSSVNKAYDHPVMSSESNFVSKIKRQPVDFDDIQPHIKHARMDRQICLFGRTFQLGQESVQSPRFNTNNLVPSGDLKSLASNKGTENLGVVHQERRLEIPRFDMNHVAPFGELRLPSTSLEGSENLGVVHQERRLESPRFDTNHFVPFGELRLPSTIVASNKSDSSQEGTENLGVVSLERLASPRRDTNHVDPFNELKLPLTCPRRNESDLVQDGTIELCEDGLKEKEESTIVIGTDVENRVSLDVEHIQPSSGCITTKFDDLSLEDRRSDHVSFAENHQHPLDLEDTEPTYQHPLDLEDTEPTFSHTVMDNHPCLVDKPLEEQSERVESPGCDTDHLVSSGDSNSPNLTCHEVNGSDLGQEESERRDVALEENAEENHVSLIDCFMENQMKEHIASLNPSMSEDIWRSGVEETEGPITIDGNTTCQLCAEVKFMFNPTPVFCASCDVRIKPHSIYYWIVNEMDRKISFCSKCHHKSAKRITTKQGVSITKAQLIRGKNDEEIEEQWVQCDGCDRWQHDICALFNALANEDGKAKYYCPFCIRKRRTPGKSLPIAFGAKDLPPTSLSDHIEERLFRHLKKDREERAELLGKNVNEVPNAEDLVLRVVHSSTKDLKVSPEFRSIFSHGDYPPEFSCESKMIMLFQKIEGVDVCLFSMYVQEFGPECAGPNQRTLYISYLDSVKYFKPEIKAASGEALRTYVYQEILVGYLEYCKMQGFMKCYLWVCPPTKCDDYILYCHPESQKIPNTQKLRKWYKAMLKKSMNEGIVLDMTNMHKQFFSRDNKCTKITAARLPYFDGDYWSRAAESFAMDFEKFGDKECPVNMNRCAKSMGHCGLTDDNKKDVFVMHKLGSEILRNKKDFIVVNMLPGCVKCKEAITTGHYWSCEECKSNFSLCSRCFNKKENKMHIAAYGKKHALLEAVMNINTPVDTGRRDDARLDNELFKNRDLFLNFCQYRHYQFDTLRRAKHSTMMILNHLKARCGFKIPNQVQVVNKDLPRALEPPALELPSISKADNETLVHASRCSRNSSCTNDRCRLFKRVFRHGTTCSKKRAGGCKYCEKLWNMLIAHSMQCEDLTCLVPRCGDMKKEYLQHKKRERHK